MKINAIIRGISLSKDSAKVTGTVEAEGITGSFDITLPRAALGTLDIESQLEIDVPTGIVEEQQEENPPVEPEVPQE